MIVMIKVLFRIVEKFNNVSTSQSTYGRLRDIPNETTFVRHNRTSGDVPRGHLIDLNSLKEDHEWTRMTTNGLKEDHEWTFIDLKWTTMDLN